MTGHQAAVVVAVAWAVDTVVAVVLAVLAEDTAAAVRRADTRCTSTTTVLRCAHNLCMFDMAHDVR